MDIDINEMFSKKNVKLFFDKLLLDLSRNTETFHLATKNIIMIETAKLFSSLKKLYSKYSSDANIEKIKEILSETKVELAQEVGVAIDEKESNHKQSIADERSKTVDKKFLKSYANRIDDNESNFEEALELCVRELANASLYKKLIDNCPCKNEEMQSELFYQINIEFSNKMIQRIKEESCYRNETLKNMSKETYDYFLDLKKATHGVLITSATENMGHEKVRNKKRKD